MKYIFFDIDNTLVSHKGRPHVPPQTRTAVNLLRKAGHIPAIATGRGAFLSMTTAKDFGIMDLVCSGGAQVIVNGQEIYRAYFPDEHVDSLNRTEIPATYCRNR